MHTIENKQSCLGFRYFYCALLCFSMQHLPYWYQLVATRTCNFICLNFLVPLKCSLSVRLSGNRHGCDVRMEIFVFRVNCVLEQ